MKILIIGARGNLGGELVKVFNKDNEVVAFDKEDIDIADKEQVLKKITDLKPEVIINAAAYNAVDKCEEDSLELDLAKKLNRDAVASIAEATMEIKATIIHYSTDYVFDGTKKEGYAEIDKPRPISKYGETKQMGEEELIGRASRGLKYYIVRTSKLFGPVGESNFSKPSFFDVMLKLGKEKKELDVVDEEMSCFTYTPDLALWTKKLINNNAEYGVYHFINEGACTWYKAAKELFELKNVNIKVNSVLSDKFPRPAKRPKFSVLKNTKFEKMRDYREALKEYLELNN